MHGGPSSRTFDPGSFNLPSQADSNACAEGARARDSQAFTTRGCACACSCTGVLINMEARG